MNFNLKLDAKVNVIKSHNNDILQKRVGVVHCGKYNVLINYH